MKCGVWGLGFRVQVMNFRVFDLARVLRLGYEL